MPVKLFSKGGLRILWAITRNDILGALKNRSVMLNVIMALAVAVFYRYLPALLDDVDAQTLLVYSADGDSGLLHLLEGSERVQVFTYPSQAAMLAALRHTDTPQMGLVIPSGFDQALEAGAAPVLEGYRMNWLSGAQIDEQMGAAQAELERLSRRAVQVETQVVYPTADSHGLPVTAAFGMVYILLMTSLPVLPHLFLEEKQTHTLDALLVSPAGPVHITAAKALTGLFYTLAGTLIGLFLFKDTFVHWGLALASILLGMGFTVALALLVGVRTESRGQMSMELWLLVIPLLAPVFFSIMDTLFPGWLLFVFRLIPTTALFNLLRSAMAGEVPWGRVLLWGGWLLAWMLALLGLVIRQVARLDRRGDQARPVRANGDAERKRSETQALSSPNDPAEALVESWRTAPGRPAPAWRIVLTIALKDMREALKNKVFLSVLLGTVLLAGTSSLLIRTISPSSRGITGAVYAVYDPGHSPVLAEWLEGSGLDVERYENREEMADRVIDSLGGVIGVAFPADFEGYLHAGERVPVALYRGYTTENKRGAQWAAAFEEALRAASGSDVSLRFEETVLYPQIDRFGQAGTLVILLTVVVFTVGAALVPLLMLEEKDAHTLDALLVSPVRMSQVVAGKTLVGGFFCLLVGGGLALVNLWAFVHPAMMLLALALTAFFAVSVGLLLGVYTRNATNAGLLGSLLLLGVIGLTVLGAAPLPGMPPLLGAVLAWLPGPAALRLFRLSMVGQVPAAAVWANTGALLAAALLLYGLVLWRVGRLERR